MTARTTRDKALAQTERRHARELGSLAKAMTADEQAEHVQLCTLVRGFLSSLRLTRCEDEDICVAEARLENWLTENDGRWVK